MNDRRQEEYSNSDETRFASRTFPLTRTNADILIDRRPFRVEGSNILNHANFGNPDTRQGSPAHGQITSLVAGNQDRIIQLGLHVQF